jgi:hypothetical protein
MLSTVLMAYSCAFLAAFALGGLAYFDRKEKSRRRAAFLYVMFFSLPGLGFLAHYALLPEAVIAQAVKEPDEGEIIKAVRDYDPATLSRLRDVIRNDALKGQPLPATINKLSLIIFQNRAFYFQRGSDIPVHELAKVYLEEIRILRVKDPKLCFELLFKPDKVDVENLRKAEREYLPKELQERVKAQFIKLIQSAQQLEAAPPTREEAAPAFEYALRNIKMRHGDEGVQILSNPSLLDRDPNKSIEIFITLLESVIDRPLYESGPALRLSFSKQK